MPAGRKNRNKRFLNRARSFVRSPKKKGEIVEEIFDDASITIGKRSNRRLVLKRPRDRAATHYLQQRMGEYLAENKIQPEHFVLVTPEGAEVGGHWIQEYFQKPTMRTLAFYFRAIGSKKKQKELPYSSYLLARSFIKNPRNAPITSSKVSSAYAELFRYYSYAVASNFIHFSGHPLSPGLALVGKNIVVLGINRDGKLRLAIIDV